MPNAIPDISSYLGYCTDFFVNTKSSSFCLLPGEGPYVLM